MTLAQLQVGYRYDRHYADSTSEDSSANAYSDVGCRHQFYSNFSAPKLRKRTTKVGAYIDSDNGEGAPAARHGLGLRAQRAGHDWHKLPLLSYECM